MVSGADIRAYCPANTRILGGGVSGNADINAANQFAISVHAFPDCPARRASARSRALLSAWSHITALHIRKAGLSTLRQSHSFTDYLPSGPPWFPGIIEYAVLGLGVGLIAATALAVLRFQLVRATPDL